MIRSSKPGAVPLRIGERRRAAWHKRLAPVDLGHVHASPIESRPNRRQDVGVLLELEAQHLRNDVARHIVGRRAKSARRDHQIDAAKRVLKNGSEVAGIVPDDGLGAHDHAEVVQPARRNSELVSTRCGVSSSLPTATISAVAASALPVPALRTWLRA